MAPRTLTRLALVLTLMAGLTLGWTAFSRRRSVSPPPFPCVATAKSGWLTAVTRAALLRIEWDETSGRVGVSTVDGLVRWEPRTEAEARALALRVLEPISAPIRSNSYDSVSLFAGCDGVGAPWRGESQGLPSYGGCLRPLGEGRLECLRRVHDERSSSVSDEAPGAVADRITAEVTARGVTLPVMRPLAARGYYGPGSPPGTLDALLDRVLPPSPEVGEDF